MTAEELRELAIKAVKASISRDAASGNGIDLLIITNDGIKSSETIQV
jgi:proteasome beta subunit